MWWSGAIASVLRGSGIENGIGYCRPVVVRRSRCLAVLFSYSLCRSLPRIVRRVDGVKEAPDPQQILRRPRADGIWLATVFQQVDSVKRGQLKAIQDDNRADQKQSFIGDNLVQTLPIGEKQSLVKWPLYVVFVLLYCHIPSYLIFLGQITVQRRYNIWHCNTTNDKRWFLHSVLLSFYRIDCSLYSL